MSSNPPTKPDNDNVELKEYRSQLISAENQAQTAYDRTVLTLSGGALGISFAFVQDFISGDPVARILLLVAWLSWILSLSLVLVSHYLSTLAMRKAIEQVDDGTIYDGAVGGAYDDWLRKLNASGGVAFIIGVVMIAIFAFCNLS
jgi:hypothetical protein